MTDLLNDKKWVMERLVPEYVPWYSKKTITDHVVRYKFATLLARNKKVLDIACGSGYGTYLLAHAGAKQVIGIDISKSTIDYALKKYAHPKIKYQVGDACHIDLTANSVDLVVSFETLEHLKDYQKFLSEIHRVLKPKGICLISTPNNLLNDEWCNEFHLHQFSQVQFQKDLGKYFSIIQMYGQKPMHAGYLNLVRKVTSVIPNGFAKWFLDSALKMMFRGVKVENIDEFRLGFVPAFFIAKCQKI